MTRLFLLLVTLPFVLFACSDDPADDDTTGDDDTAAVDPEVVDPDRMYDELSLLASDEYGGRAPATEGNEMALQYVEAVFEEYGLMPVGEDGTYRQYFPFEKWELTDASSLDLGDEELVEGDDFRPLTRSGGGEAAGELVFTGYGMTVPAYDPAEYPDCPMPEAGYDDYEGVDVTGEVVLVLRHGPGDDIAVESGCPANEAAHQDEDLWTFGYKAANAALHGAAAVILVQDYRHDGSLLEGDVGIYYYDADLPVLTVRRDRVEEQLPALADWAEAIDAAHVPQARATGVDVALSVSAAVVEHQVPNLLGSVEGSGDEVVVIGAHIDHLGTDAITGEIYNGGDDNASGTVVMMELARLLATCGEVPERTVLFAAFNAEESGLIGSCFYVGEPSYPHEDTVAAISVDMVGAGDGGGLNLFGALMEEYLWLAQLMDAAAAEQGLPYDTFANVPVLASDHVCFITQEITAVMAQTTGPHEHYHTPDDTPANNSPDNLAAAAHLMWAALEPLAMGTEAPYLEGEYDPLGATAAPAGPPDLRPELR
jgi:hypothetical protein